MLRKRLDVMKKIGQETMFGNNYGACLQVLAL